MGALFIDFKSAYNTVNRNILYQRLIQRKILAPEEVDWLHDLHSKIQIRSGKASFFPMNGLHQGSMISPLLFDIYVEPIIAILHHDLAIPYDDILFYADDLAVICPRDIVERVIGLIERTAKDLSLILNKKKSGVIIIQSSRFKNRKPIDKSFTGIPVVDKYRYLGVEIHPKMGISRYLTKVQQKSVFIRKQLRAILWNSEPEIRRKLWVALIRPLYDYVFPIYENLSSGDRYRLDTNLRLSFKKFLGLRVSTDNDILRPFLGDLQSYIRSRARRTKIKLLERFYSRSLQQLSYQKGNYTPLFPQLDLIPPNYIRFLNSLDASRCALCPKTQMTWHHLAFHQIIVRNPLLVLEFQLQQWKNLHLIKNINERETARYILLRDKVIWQERLN